MSTEYLVLDNRPIDQWKVVELKEELKRRNLATKGLKDDLIKRLDEAIRDDRDTEKEEEAHHKANYSDREDIGNGFDSEPDSQVRNEDVDTKLNETPSMEVTGVKTRKSDDEEAFVDVDDSSIMLDQGKLHHDQSMVPSDSSEVVTQPILAISVENDISDGRSTVNIASGSHELQNNEINLGKEDPKPPHKDAVLNVSNPNNQVSEVSATLGFQVKSDSISTSMSINEKNELKDNLNADNFHIELDKVKPEIVQPSSSGVPHSSGDIHPLVDHETYENQDFNEERDDTNATNVDFSQKNDRANGGYAEKLNLDPSPGDDFMEDDVMETKQVGLNHNFDELRDPSDLIKDRIVKEGSPLNATRAGLSPEKKDISAGNNTTAIRADKRKLEDQEVVRYIEPPKRQRRWNSESLKVPEPKNSSNPRLLTTPLTTPKDVFQPTISKHRSASTLSDGDTPKERVVPVSQEPPSNSLRIENFLRPFTLKAAQELLAKTGTLCSFWMDHIKTHCYVTFSSVKEAIETRNAVYNLQWPPNGGKLLVADFVDPQEVKIRAEAPQPCATPSSNTMVTPPAPSQPQPSPRQNVPKQHLPPPPPLPQPPSISDSPIARERLPPPPPPTKFDLPRERLPLPPLSRKPNPPIVTLDDLFKKTRATPRIYYQPLSEEDVAAKLAASCQSTK